MSSHLEGGRVNVSLLQKHLQKEFLRLLDKCDGEKSIIWDHSLAGPIGLIIAKNSILKDHNVTRMFKFNYGKLPIPNNIKNIIFIARPEESLMDMIADNIREEQKNPGTPKEYHLFFVPRRTKICLTRLEEKGVFGSLYIEDLPMDIYPFDYDLISMEYGKAFRDSVLDKDPTYIYQAAEALMTLQLLYGVIPRVSGKGQAAFQLHNLMKRLAQEPRATPPSASQIDHLVLIDRSIDLITPLATQLTYEGLIDEIFKINCTTALLPEEKFEQTEERHNEINEGQKKLILNSGDELYSEIRDKSFSAVAPVLNKKTKSISNQIEERTQADNIDKMKEFVAKLPHIMANKRSLSIHLTIAKLIKEVTDSNEFLESINLEQSLLLGIETDKIQNHIEDLIGHQVPLNRVLRLICLQSATNSGLKPKVWEYYKREIIQTYGFHHLLTLTNLEDAGLITIQQNSRSYTNLRRILKLTVEDESETVPNDISYVYSMYAPLSIRLVQHLVKMGSWNRLSDVLPGPIVDSLQPVSSNHKKRRGSGASEASSQTDSKKIVLVFFLGGCTFAEISALRFLSQQEDSNVEFIIATTKLINGNSFLEELSEPLKPT